MKEEIFSTNFTNVDQTKKWRKTYNGEAKDVPYISYQIRLGIVQIKTRLS